MTLEGVWPQAFIAISIWFDKKAWGPKRLLGGLCTFGEIIQKATLGALGLSALVSLTACGADLADACEKYVVSVDSCIVEYANATGMDSDALLLDEALCEDTYGDQNDRETAVYLNCLADVYDAADCSTADGYAAVGTDALDCAR